MKETSRPLPIQKAEFRDGQEFLGEPLRSQCFWAAQPRL